MLAKNDLDYFINIDDVTTRILVKKDDIKIIYVI